VPRGQSAPALCGLACAAAGGIGRGGCPNEPGSLLIPPGRRGHLEHGGGATLHSVVAPTVPSSVPSWPYPRSPVHPVRESPSPFNLRLRETAAVHLGRLVLYSSSERRQRWRARAIVVRTLFVQALVPPLASPVPATRARKEQARSTTDVHVWQSEGSGSRCGL